MNFFGHAVVARWLDPSPAFVLGAMLPDFASMLRTRPPTTPHEGLLSGIRFHHRTDEAFHEALVFRELQRQAFEWLSERGLNRGSARAVAHIGVEIFLDGTLAADHLGCEAYVGALLHAEPAVLGQHIEWQSAEIQARFDKLRLVLQQRGIMNLDVSAELVAQRLKHALLGRPRLALDPLGERIVQDWAMVAHPVIADRAPALLAELRTRLPETQNL